MSKIERFRKKVIKILKKSKRQFYDEEDNKITVEEYFDLLTKQKIEDMNAFLNKLKRNRKWKG